jgi:hypothetical protein
MKTSRLPAVLFLAALSVGLLLPACARRERSFQQAYARAASGKQGGELLAALVALDQEYPRQLSLKVNLGALCLAAGDLRAAAAYLEQGERIAAGLRYRRDRRLRYLLQANLAEQRLRARRPAESATHADRALALGVEDELGVVYTRAKAWLTAGNYAAALADFAAGRGVSRAMNLEDYGAYIQALVRSGRPAEALLACRERRQRFGYHSGQGLEESLLYERLGRLGEAVLSAFLELEHRRGAAGGSDEVIRRNLAQLTRRFQGQAAEPAAQVVEGLDHYLAGRWARAQASLAGVRLRERHVALQYLLLAVRLEQGATACELDGYVELEPELRTLAAYYYHLWRGLRGSGGAYGFTGARPVLEKTILLAPEGSYAEQTRAEIGRLLGLEPSQGRRLLLGQEVQALVRRAAAQRRPEALEPVLALLGLPDTPYTAEALLLLRETMAVPALRQYLERRKTESSGRLQERLVGLLGGQSDS